jgi:hypothetical protein
MSEAVAQATIDMLVAKDEGVDNAERRTAQASTPTRSVSADLDDAHQRRGERARGSAKVVGGTVAKLDLFA